MVVVFFLSLPKIAENLIFRKVKMTKFGGRIKREERLDTQGVMAGDGWLKIKGAYTHT